MSYFGRKLIPTFMLRANFLSMFAVHEISLSPFMSVTTSSVFKGLSKTFGERSSLASCCSCTNLSTAKVACSPSIPHVLMMLVVILNISIVALSSFSKKLESCELLFRVFMSFSVVAKLKPSLYVA